MDILYVTSEAAPFCKTGGLADVLGSLPPAVAAGGDRTAVILAAVRASFGRMERENALARLYLCGPGVAA